MMELWRQKLEERLALREKLKQDPTFLEKEARADREGFARSLYRRRERVLKLQQTQIAAE